MTRVIRTTLTFALLFPALEVIAERFDHLIIKKDAKVNAIVLSLVIDPNLSEELNSAGGNSEAGKRLCERFGGSSCYSVSSIGQGICKAGGGSSCYAKNTVQQGLDSIPNEDRYWYWDQFNDQYGNTIWRCRGSQTGRFAENEKCAGQTKDDERWPG